MGRPDSLLLDGDPIQRYRHPPKPARFLGTQLCIFAPGDTVSFQIDGSDFSDQQGFHDPADVERWTLYSGRTGQVLHEGAGFTTSYLGTWTDPALQGLPEGHYIVRFRTSTSTASLPGPLPGDAVGYSIWATPAQDYDEQGVGQFVIARNHAALPRPTDYASVPGSGDDMRLRAVIGQGQRMEIRLHSSTPWQDYHSANAVMRSYLDTWYYPYQTNLPHPVPVTFPDFTTGDGALVTTILADPVYNHSEMIAMAMNEANEQGSPEGGALGDGLIIPKFVEFRDAVKAARSSMKVSSPSAVRIDATTWGTGTGGGHRAFYNRLIAEHPTKLPDVVMFHDYPGDYSPYGARNYYDDFFAMLASEFPTIAALPRHTDESAGSGASNLGHGRLAYQILGVLGPQVMRRRHKMNHTRTNYYYVSPRELTPEWPLRGGYPFPVVAHLITDAQEYSDVVESSVAELPLGAESNAFFANIGTRLDGTKLLQVLPFVAGATLRLKITGSTAAIPVRSGWGPDLASITPGVGGVFTITWDDMASRYLAIPSGATVTYEGPDLDQVDPETLGIEYLPSTQQSYGSTQILTLLYGTYKDSRALNGETEGGVTSCWISPDTLAAKPAQTLRIHFDTPCRPARILLEGPAMMHQQCPPRAGTVSAPLSGGAAEIGSFDVPHVELNWPSSEWQGRVVTLGDGAAASAVTVELDCPERVSYVDVTITRTTAGGVPSLTAALMRGVNGVQLLDLLKLGNGHYAEPRPMLARATVWEDPSAPTDELTVGYALMTTTA